MNAPSPLGTGADPSKPPLDVDEVLSVLCHDLGATAWAISGFTEQLSEQSTASRALTGVAAHFVEQVAGLRAVRSVLVEDTSVSEVDVSHFLSTLSKEVGERFDPSAAVSLHGEPIVVQCSRSLLRRALEPVLDNAFRFRTAGGGLVAIAWSSTPTDVQITVTDDGIGMSPFAMDRATKLFYRGVSRSAFPGVGTGLTVAALAVHRLGGTLSIDSAPDEGTTVRVSVPLKAPA